MENRLQRARVRQVRGGCKNKWEMLDETKVLTMKVIFYPKEIYPKFPTRNMELINRLMSWLIPGEVNYKLNCTF